MAIYGFRIARTKGASGSCIYGIHTCHIGYLFQFICVSVCLIEVRNLINFKKITIPIGSRQTLHSGLFTKRY